MYQLIIIVHVLLGLGIIGLVLMQQGRGADAGAAFGSGSSGSVFGAQGSASFLSRTTAIFAALFFTTSLSLAYLSGQSTVVADLMADQKIEKNAGDVPLVESAPVKAAGSAATAPVAAPIQPTAAPDVVVPTEGK
ncbi:MAG: preprotein translocase subunit SecG [Methylococcales bacterium]|nr:preprotein translocase subunit SecG [Methylococcales bacterium]